MNLFHMKKSLLAFALGFSAVSFGQMTMNASASMLVPGTCDCYRLTTNASAVRGAIWSPGMIDLTQSFDMTFDIYAGNPSDEFYAGDGMVFVLQQNPTGIGDFANAIGYKDNVPLNSPAISGNSLGIEIDTYNNSPSVFTDIAADHIGINSNGSNDHNIYPPVAIPNIEDGLYHEFRVIWSPTLNLLTVTLDGTFIFAHTINLTSTIFGGNPMVYFGFTSATGGSFNEHRVCSYRNAAFTSDLTSVCSDLPVSFTDNSTSDLNIFTEYAWDFGDGSPLDFNENPTHSFTTPGTYTVELVMTDASGCTDNSTLNITVLPDLIVNVTGTDITCFGDGDGQAVATSSNGTGPFNYLWDDVLAQTTQTITNLGAATYNVTVTDNLGCVGTGTVTIAEPTELTVDIHGADLLCFGDSDGVGTAIAVGGTGTPTYLWDDALAQTTSAASGLSAGTYTVTATDANGCTAIDTYTVSQPSEIIITGVVTQDNGTTNGGIDATVVGGTTPYSSTVWSNSAITEDITGLGSGNYTITVTDANGCTKDTTFNIKSSVGLTDVSGSDFVIYPNPTNGQFQIQLMGDYQIIIHDAAGRIVFTQNALDDTNVNLKAEGGVYIVEVIKNNQSYFQRLVIQ
jgi:PKD repeat protein